MKWAAFGCVVSLFLANSAVPEEKKDEPKIEIEETTIADLMKAIASHKGKVVVVEVWAEF